VSPASRCRDWPDRLATLAVFFANGLGLGAWVAAFTSVLPMLCGAAAMAGACTGAVDVLMNVHASSIERRWRAPIMSSFHAAFSVGGMAGAVLGGSLAPRGATAELGAAATLCAVVVLAAAFVMRAGDVAPAGRSLAVPGRARLTLGLLAMLSLMIEGAVADWSGTLLAQGGADIRSTTFGYGAFSCAMAGGRLLGDWLVGRFGAATIVCCGGVLAAAGLALVAWVQTPLEGAVGFGLVGLGLANVVPTVFSATGRMGTSAAAAVVTAGYAGLLLGPVAIGSVATAANLSWGMAVLAVAAAAVSNLAARSGFFAPRICHGP
jgi:MFS family permease